MLPIPVGVAPQLHHIRWEDARKIKGSPHAFLCNIPFPEYKVGGKFPWIQFVPEVNRAICSAHFNSYLLIALDNFKSAFLTLYFETFKN